MEARSFENVDAAGAALTDRPCELLVISALRWTMTQHPKYEPHRAQWANSTSSAFRNAVVGHLQRGGALLAMHTAILCFDDWPLWSEILGGSWVWGRSSHPPYGQATTRMEALTHPITRGVRDFDSQDEVYSDLSLARSVDVLASSRVTESDWMPTVWVREWQGAKVCVDALGHDVNSLSQPDHQRLIRQAIDWLMPARPIS